jgi:membrane dipeptidase
MVPLSFSHSEKYGHLGIKTLHGLANNSEGRFVIVKSVSEIKSAFEQKGVAAVIHFEGAEPIAEDLSNLEEYYQKGLRSVGVVWSRPNAFGYGVPFKFPSSPDIGPGLTSTGKELIRACNRMGILIDVSHLNEKGFWDVEKTSDAPLVASHSCVHEICPMPRNLTDKQLDAIKNRQGLVGLNFGVEFIRSDGARNLETPISKMVEHIRYVADRIGVEHIALGSDFDGAQISNELKDVAGLPKLLSALSQDGFDADAINKIAHENWIRVLTQTWK